MTKRAARSAPILPLCLVGMLGSANAGFAQPKPPASGAGTVALTATVRSVDARVRTVEVVTGVGSVLRVVKLACGERVEVKGVGVVVPLAQLKLGDFVRVEYT